jgi:hypothetical protein
MEKVRHDVLVIRRRRMPAHCLPTQVKPAAESGGSDFCNVESHARKKATFCYFLFTEVLPLSRGSSIECPERPGGLLK